MILFDLPLTTLLDEFASDRPTPGGGSASALAGALSVSLGEMVVALTEGKKSYEKLPDAEKAIFQRLKSELTSLRDPLTQAIAADAEAFNGVMAAYKLPKETDEQKTTRSFEIQKATRVAIDIPLKVARLSIHQATIAEQLLYLGNPNAITDAAVAVQLALTAVEGALYNVEINLGSYNDELYKNQLVIELKDVRARVGELRQNVDVALREKVAFAL
jgi:methenyltetrahydrofolate cyclohydrolase